MAESVKQEKKNLMEDMPVDKKASMSMKPGMFQMKKGFQMKPGQSSRESFDKGALNQNAFYAALNDAKENNKDSFTVGGKKFQVSMEDPMKMEKPMSMEKPMKMKDPMQMKNPPLKAYGRKPLKMDSINKEELAKGATEAASENITQMQTNRIENKKMLKSVEQKPRVRVPQQPKRAQGLRPRKV